MKKILIFTGGSLLLLVAILGTFWWWLNCTITNAFIHGISTYLQADAEFEDVHLDLLSGNVHAEGGVLRNLNPQAVWSEVHIGQADAIFQFSQLFKYKTPTAIEMDQVKMILGKRADQKLILTPAPPESADNTTASTSPPPPAKRTWPKIEIVKITVHHGQIVGDKQYPVQVGNLELIAEKTAGADDWSGVLKSQSAAILSLPFGLCNAHFSTTEDSVDVDSYQFAAGDGAISGHATLPKDVTQPAQIHYELNAVPLAVLVPANWNMILSGPATGIGDFQGSITDFTQGQAKGQIQLRSADLKALPFLDKLASLPGLAGLGHVSLDVAKTDYAYDKGAVVLSNLRLEKINTIAMTGDLAISTDGLLNGTAKVGLPSLVVGLVPKFKEDVFTSDDGQYSWADVKISGTADHIQEDLTLRIVAALGEQGKAIIQGSLQKAIDLYNGFMGKPSNDTGTPATPSAPGTNGN